MRGIVTVLFTVAAIFSCQAVALASNAQPYEFKRIGEVSLSKGEIVRFTRSYFAEKFVSGRDVVQMADEQLGKVVADVILDDPNAGMFDVFTRIKARLAIDAKDGRYRLRAVDIVGLSSDSLDERGGDINGMNRDRIEPMANNILKQFADDLHVYLQRAKQDAEW